MEKITVVNLTDKPIEGGMNLERFVLPPLKEVVIPRGFFDIIKESHPGAIKVVTKLQKVKVKGGLKIEEI